MNRLVIDAAAVRAPDTMRSAPHGCASERGAGSATVALVVLSASLGWSGNGYAKTADDEAARSPETRAAGARPGLLPDRVNQVIIQADTDDLEPTFHLLFSAAPLRSRSGGPLTSITRGELALLGADTRRGEVVAVKVHGLRASRPGRFDYFFGRLHQADMPWNDGRETSYRDWARHSDEVWDCLAIVYEPSTASRRARTRMLITAVAVRRGGQLLFDSRASRSASNGRRMAAGLPPTDMSPRGDVHPVLDLGDRAARFRQQYYELDGDILADAFDDLGQTDKRKYARRGKAWCSEFISHVYRLHGIMTPDPNAADVHYANLRTYFGKHGRVYSQREVASWPDEKKRKLISPGSMVSIETHGGASTHSLLFTTWVAARGEPLRGYSAISGSSHGGQVAWNRRIDLPLPTIWAGMSDAELREFDRKWYFAVPGPGRRKGAPGQ